MRLSFASSPGQAGCGHGTNGESTRPRKPRAVGAESTDQKGRIFLKGGGKMPIIILLILMGLLLRLTVFFLRSLGKLFGVILGILSFTLLAVLAVFCFSLSLLALPIIILFGLIGVILAAARF